VPADRIFVLMLVMGVVLGLGWLSLDSRRRAAAVSVLRIASAAWSLPRGGFRLAAEPGARALLVSLQ